jgi:hypothetical protein
MCHREVAKFTEFSCGMISRETDVDWVEEEEGGKYLEV